MFTSSRRPAPLIALLLAILLPATLFWATPLQAAQPLRLVLQWEHQAQFAGYYVAQELGYYAEEGLQVEIVPGGPAIDAPTLVENGEADFCSAMLAPVLARQAETAVDAERRLVLLLQLINRSTLTLVAWKNGADGHSPIHSIADLDGRRVSLWPAFATAYHQFFARQGVRPQVVPQHYSLSLFLRRGVDACSAMLYNEYHSLLQQGVNREELSLFDFHALGFYLPEDGLYCRRGFYQQQPQRCAAFARASLRGWQTARQQPQLALDLVMRQVEAANLPVNRAHMAWMLQQVLQAIFAPEDQAWPTGRLRPEDYTGAGTLLGLSGRLPSYDDFVTPEARHGLH